MHNRTNWCILYTKPKCERKVAETLARLQLNSYCPVTRTARQTGEWRKMTEDVLFPSYVFVQCGPEKAAELMRVDGVLGPVYWLKEPVEVPAAEMTAMREFLSVNRSVRMVQSEVSPGSTLMDTVRSNGRGHSEAVLELPTLGCTLSAKLDRTSRTVVRQLETKVSYLSTN